PSPRSSTRLPATPPRSSTSPIGTGDGAGAWRYGEWKRFAQQGTPTLPRASFGDRAMFNFEEALKLMTGHTVLCVGDLMLDDFVYGEVSRISPEAPAPVLAVAKNEVAVGAAGNVARNIVALGARC